jgi:protoheme IX farnesyltransferase
MIRSFMTRAQPGIVDVASEALAAGTSARIAPSIDLAPRKLIADAMALAKPGIVRLVTITSGVGLALGAMQRGMNSWTIGEFIALTASTLIGTALSAAGANTLNQAWEARRDALMRRTESRPIPAGRFTAAQGFALGSSLGLAGVLMLLLIAGPWAAGVSLTTILIYVLIYTPMKPVSVLSTWVGAVPGALPPLIGWAAACTGGPSNLGGLDLAGGWTVFLIMFAWQIPHFLAIAWKYREDYARGGFRVLSVIDPDGARTAWTSFVWTIIMIAVSLTPMWAMPARVGWFYGVPAIVAGLGMLWFAIKLLRARDDAAARGLFLASLAYLPLILFVLVADAALPPLR